MISFLNVFDRKRGFAQWAGPSIFVLLSIVFLSAGCKKGGQDKDLPVVVTNRIADPAYVEELRQLRYAQGTTAKARNAVVAQMNDRVEAAKAKLPKGATDEQIKAELAKDPAWKNLEEENQKRIGDIEAQLAAAREAVRKRIAQEAADTKAVKEGRARVAK